MINLNIYTFLVGLFDSLLNSDVIFQILLQYILSIIILKEHFYKHHYLSISINAICFIILLLFDFLDIELEFLYVFIYDLYILFLDLENAYGKKAMMYGYISPFSLLIYKGVYKIILTIIFLIIFIPIMITVEKDFLVDIEYFDTNKLFLIIIGFFSKFFKYLFNWILVDRFSPSHLALSLIF